MLQQSYPRKMLFVGRAKGKAQYVHNATVVRSHSAVLVAVEIEWARRLSGGGELRSPSEILGKSGVVLLLCWMGRCYCAKSLQVGMEGLGRGGGGSGLCYGTGGWTKREALHKTKMLGCRPRHGKKP